MAPRLLRGSRFDTVLILPVFKTLAERLAALQLAIAGLAVLAILGNISVDVFLRAAFNAPFSSTIEIVSFYCMVPLAFLPIATLEITDGHIRTDLFYRLFPRGGQIVADVLSAILTIGIYSLLSWVTFKQAVVSTGSGELAMGVALLPIWPVRWVLPFAFATSAAIALFMVVLHLTGRNGRD